MANVPQPEEEDAALLKFGKDFQKARCLMNCEVAIILERRQEQAQQAPGSEEAETTISPMFQKTIGYVQRFSRYKTRQAIGEVRELLTSKGLEDFQIAAIGNLCPETSEEAKSLIPSLADRLDDDEAQSILTDLASFRKFT